MAHLPRKLATSLELRLVCSQVVWAWIALLPRSALSQHGLISSGLTVFLHQIFDQSLKAGFLFFHPTNHNSGFLFMMYWMSPDCSSLRYIFLMKWCWELGHLLLIWTQQRFARPDLKAFPMTQTSPSLQTIQLSIPLLSWLQKVFPHVKLQSPCL